MCATCSRAAASCVVFFDELEDREGAWGWERQRWRRRRPCAEPNHHRSGMNAKKNMFISSATNRPDQIDSTLRPGRLDQLIHFPLLDQPPSSKQEVTLPSERSANAPRSWPSVKTSSRTSAGPARREKDEAAGDDDMKLEKKAEEMDSPVLPKFLE
ncbi:hypothetical protein B0H11DRAFT_455471 [Mycena galericulata]|nr:hypothetical protein B0H11DRAFT_455471 [Mycena galericulata]